ncbi:hypothetical protein HMPREF0044_0283 [Gleimia coleocanis DSM 15436]|uniref:Bacterial sensory transduction regulator n=1 Tax=Gleimia coleocanis DSM 15436 TaxID=525245 RepID=C0VYP3_9ACTO|nr:YbjN domain-containing protein [Gleimia coleocanis]EEH64546.1 hypothetical protein HMPREF0044_0283 [Gleimia coleocanis DSM 15436]
MHLHCVENTDEIQKVTFERISEQLTVLDAKLEIDAEHHTALARINDVPFQFNFTSGDKFLSIRAIWESGLEKDASKMAHLFTAADSWNREKYFPTVYIEWTGETAHVVADYIVGVEAGLDNAQLLENISAAVSTGIDALQFMAHVVSTIKSM